MHGTRWRKVRRDLWHYRSKTILTVLSMAVGVAGLGAILGMNTILTRELEAANRSIVPSTTVLLAEGLDPAVLESVRRIDGVRVAEARHKTTARLYTGDNQVHDLDLYA